MCKFRRLMSWKSWHGQFSVHYSSPLFHLTVTYYYLLKSGLVKKEISTYLPVPVTVLDFGNQR